MCTFSISSMFLKLKSKDAVFSRTFSSSTCEIFNFIFSFPQHCQYKEYSHVLDHLDDWPPFNFSNLLNTSLPLCLKSCSDYQSPRMTFNLHMLISMTMAILRLGILPSKGGQSAYILHHIHVASSQQLQRTKFFFCTGKSQVKIVLHESTLLNEFVP